MRSKQSGAFLAMAIVAILCTTVGGSTTARTSEEVL